tara:strand:+ start:5743 stop:6183 length:441 start_codon:yes stop_codon:yes gene_type:complete
MIMKKLIFFIFFLTACSANIITDSNEPVETTTASDLTVCEILEIEYIELSNKLFNTSFELNRFIDDISPNNVDSDRDQFFRDMEKNWDYKEIYKDYLEIRLNVYSNINKLYENNSDCIVSGDQEISIEQVKAAEKDLSNFVSKYEN